MVLTRVVDTNFENKKNCYFCGGNHLCRECPQEILLAPILKKYIGNIMENFIGDNFNCPCCDKRNMEVLGNHSPSLDIICRNCNRKYEVKSKCLSINKLPKDLKLPHGNYNDYLKRQQSGLDLFVIIYKVDRIKKKVTIREVLYSKNEDIQKKNNICVVKRENNHLSTIIINDRNMMTKLNLRKKYQFDFSSIIENYLNLKESIDSTYLNNLNSCMNNLEV